MNMTAVQEYWLIRPERKSETVRLTKKQREMLDREYRTAREAAKAVLDLQEKIHIRLKSEMSIRPL